MIVYADSIWISPVTCPGCIASSAFTTCGGSLSRPTALVIAHVHPEIVFRDFFCEQTEILIALGCLRLLEHVLRFLAAPPSPAADWLSEAG